MTDFLLELLSEEIPARMQEKAAADLVRLFEAALAKAGLKAATIESLVTPRRLALIARGLPLATETVSEELKGPRADAPSQALAGFLGKTGLTRDQLVERADAKGNAVLFAVIERAGRPTREVLADAILAIVRTFPWPKAMRWGAASLSTESPRWVRPLQGIVALFGEVIVPVEIAGIASGAATVGHRFHHPGMITIGSADDYAEKLRACHVIVDPQERRRIVREGAEAAAQAAGLALVPDEGLVAENAGLTEWPVPLLGRFDPDFLAVPREVIQLTMRTNQKYFACTDASGALAPAFVCTANIDASDGGAVIVAGNAKVLAARLSDARFFWEQDRKVPLDVQREKLSGIVFHEKLGTVADKVERVAKLASWLIEEGIVSSSPVKGRGTAGAAGGGGVSATNASPAASPLHQPAAAPQFQVDHAPGMILDRRGRSNLELLAGEDVKALADMAEQAARLAKADLVTGMVGEFPELQGVMGGYYARAEGYPDAVADAIRDHYKPVGQGDDVPTAPVTVAVSLADKLDTFVSYFRLSEFPTGSRDPYALRRAVLAIVALLVSNDIRLSIQAAIDTIIALHRPRAYREAVSGNEVIRSIYDPEAIEDVIVEHPGFGLDRETFIVINKDRRFGPFVGDPFTDLWDKLAIWHAAGGLDRRIFDFAADRLKVQQREAGVRHDLIDAVFVLGGEDDLVRLLARVKALQAFVETGEGANLLAGYRRAANILRAEAKKADGAPDDFAGFPYDPDPAERALADALDAQLPLAEQAIATENFAVAMTALSVLRPAIDRFFDEVIVNADEPARRGARLALLAKLIAAMHKVADFSKIEG